MLCSRNVTASDNSSVQAGFNAAEPANQSIPGTCGFSQLHLQAPTQLLTRRLFRSFMHCTPKLVKPAFTLLDYSTLIQNRIVPENEAWPIRRSTIRDVSCYDKLRGGDGAAMYSIRYRFSIIKKLASSIPGGKFLPQLPIDVYDKSE